MAGSLLVLFRDRTSAVIAQVLAGDTKCQNTEKNDAVKSQKLDETLRGTNVRSHIQSSYCPHLADFSTCRSCLCALEDYIQTGQLCIGLPITFSAGLC